MSDRDLSHSASHSAPLSGSGVEFCAERNVLAWRVVEPGRTNAGGAFDLRRADEPRAAREAGRLDILVHFRD